LVQRKAVTPRPLTAQERSWIQEILEHHPRWTDVDIAGIQVVAKCDCGKCRTVYLDSSSPQNPSVAGTMGYTGRIEVRTDDDFLITITLDQRDGKLSELYVDPVDLNEPRNRILPEVWRETGHTVTRM
jgi:hypothetical protein